MSRFFEWRRAFDEARAERPVRVAIACVVGILGAVLFPSDLASYRTSAPDNSALVVGTDTYLRFVNTAVQAAMPILTRDPVGAAQLIYVAVATTAATHGLKFLVDSTAIWGDRLGERPSGPGSSHNMPSGHSSMASCAVWFVGRRYGWWHLVYLLPIMLLTMYARVELHAHTISAVIAGMLIGILMAAMYTSRRKSPPPAQGTRT